MTSTARRARPTDTVRSIMVEGPATVGPGDSLLAVAEQLVAGEIGAVLVRAPGGPVGLLSERDLVTAFVSGGDLGTEQAGDVMTADLVTAGIDETIASAGRRMDEAGVRHLPVRDGEAVVGLVAQRDVLAVLLGALDG
ncbi:CBS domain-containing protein [Pseudonocardia abyssalis]|uniref:CBS domain-containing protein n=1 Tax=Pseudonocardia abyssalis TaxID=2792008 RepID=A0ABS6UPE6_9PSEU|nr:CBS domain-containing protein [Pseudonocardia abyssalis]MBW0119430.1 CBS domain-containing protein [Pseudonocardia abyssalis]MBW0133826.1 CBS domain-containing protein [Pseudonocardia abyssalis]